jgi:thiol-disulfide isomerase/thioredoxin
METGIGGLPAPPLEHVRWIDENGNERSPLTLAELGHGYTILYFFQDWCAGCHAHGFPTFVTLAEELRDKGVGLAAIQTFAATGATRWRWSSRRGKQEDLSSVEHLR